MLFKEGLTTARILAVFGEEVGVRRGEVTQTFDDGSRLYARAVLPHFADVRPDDQLRGGVAIKATQDGVWLYPYLFRLVCCNGAIAARTIDERPIADPHLREPEAVLHAVREAVAACSKEEVFRSAVGQMRATAATFANDLLLTVLPMLYRLSARSKGNPMSRFIDRSVREAKAPQAGTTEAGALEDKANYRTRAEFLQSFSRLADSHRTPARSRGDLLIGVLSQYRQERDESQFGLANAITAVARDVQDAELKWDLEKLGGAVAIGAIRCTTDDRELAAEAAASLLDKELVRTA